MGKKQNSCLFHFKGGRSSMLLNRAARIQHRAPTPHKFKYTGNVVAQVPQSKQMIPSHKIMHCSWIPQLLCSALWKQSCNDCTGTVTFQRCSPASFPCPPLLSHITQRFRHAGNTHNGLRHPKQGYSWASRGWGTKNAFSRFGEIGQILNI